MPKRKGTESDIFKEWTSKITLAKDVRKQAGEDQWLDYINMYDNKNWNLPQLAQDIKPVVINMIRATVGLLKDVTYFQDPTVNVSVDPGDGDYEEIAGTLVESETVAELIESIINQMFPKLKVKSEAKLSILDALLTPCGWMKWYHETETISEMEGVEEVTSERFVARRVYWGNMWVDPEAEAFGLHRCKWIAERKLLEVEAAKRAYKDAEGSEVAMKDIVANATVFDTADSKRKKIELKGNDSKKLDRVEIFEIHDRQNNELIEISPSIGILRKEEHPYHLTANAKVGFIYSCLTLSDESTEGFYPRPWVEDLIQINNAINRLATYKVGHVGRTAARKLSVPQNMYDAPNKEKLINGGDGEVLEHQQDLNSSDVFVIPNPEIPQDAWRLLDMFSGPVFREVSRIDEMTRGNAAPGTSPTEAQLISQGTGVGLDAKRDGVEDFITDGANILLAQLQQFVSTKQAIQIVGPTGVNWMPWDKESIAGGYSVKVEAYSTTPFDMNFNKRESVDLLNLLYDKPEVDNVELIRDVLQKFRLRSRVMRRATRQGPQDPGTEHGMLLQGTPIRVDPSEDHGDHIAAHEAFLQYLASIGEGDERVLELFRMLSRHVQQHRAAVVNIGQPQQPQQAAQGQLGNPAQPGQDIAQNRQIITGQPGIRSGASLNQQSLAAKLGGG